MACGCCGDGECRLTNFGLEHDTPPVFVNSQWRNKISQVCYLVYRVIIAVIFTVVLILSGSINYGWYTKPENSIKWFVYLSNWMLLVVTLDVVVEMIVVTIAINRRKLGNNYEKMPWYFKAQWILYNLASDVAIFVAIFYWILIYPKQSGSIHFISIFKHIICAVYIIINLFITGIPIRLLHFWQPILFGLIYITFSVIYDFCGGTNTKSYPFIYKSLDWSDNPKKAAIHTCMSFVAAVVVWVLLYALYRIRLCLARCCRVEEYSTNNANVAVV